MPNKKDPIRRIRARSAKEALALARARYGDNAIILFVDSRWKFLSWLGLSRVEVGVLDGSFSRSLLEDDRQNPLLLEKAKPDTQGMSSLKQDMESLKRLLERSSLDKEEGNLLGDSPELLDLFHDLVGQGMHPSTLLDAFRRILKDFEVKAGIDIEKFKESLTQELRSYIRVLGPIKPEKNQRKLIVFIGSTGVGKTTTMAKIAANQILNGGVRVGFLAMDTYRIAAVEQLRIYAKIIGAPIEVVNAPQDIQEKLSKLSWAELIFVDTAGRSPYDEPKLLELQALKPHFVSSLRCEVFLIVSATTVYDELLRLYEAFSVIPIDGIVVTKLDETRRFGDIWRFLVEKKVPVAYFATGQRVPDDIMMATPEALTKALLMGRMLL
jgi:flagellar biosynthesis protein FlhF